MEYIDKLSRRVFIFTCLEIVVSCCHSGGKKASLRDSNLITTGDWLRFEGDFEGDFEESTTITVETNA